YYVVVHTGGPFEHVFTDNNDGISDAIAVVFVAPPQGDLEVILVSGPTAIAEGESATVTWRVRNNGPDAITGSWSDQLLLAPNGDLSHAVALRSFTNSLTLGAGLSYTRSEQVALPREQGVFRFFVRTDA